MRIFWQWLFGMQKRGGSAVTCRDQPLPEVSSCAQGEDWTVAWCEVARGSAARCKDEDGSTKKGPAPRAQADSMVASNASELLVRPRANHTTCIYENTVRLDVTAELSK